MNLKKPILKYTPRLMIQFRSGRERKEPGLRTLEILALSFEMTPAQLLRGIGSQG